ncbi:MAG: ABC transporter permease [Flavobacteriales bacterium]|jgi:putative ABC transport system permease protein|nr:ABC transporter permease [Flavobacteriales bacterium]
MWLRNLVNIIKEAFNFATYSLIAHKLRTSLSLFGIIIGIFSVVIIFAIVDSLERNIQNDIEQIGKDVIFVKKMSFFDIKTRADFIKQKGRPALSISEAKKLEKLCTSVEAISFLAGEEGITIKTPKTSVENVVVMGVTQNFSQTSTINVEEGRYFSELEQNTAGNVAIISKEISDILYPIRGALSQEVHYRGKKYTIIGILKRQGKSMFNQNGGSMLYLPAKTLGKIINLESDRFDASYIAKPKEGVSLTLLKSEIEQKYRSIRKLKPYQKNNFSTISSEMIQEMIGPVFAIMNSVGGIIGLFALLVGTFGISNIMSVSVKERTGEIGIQKALGAPKIYILIQFLFESIILSFLGGVLSLLFVQLVFNYSNNHLDIPFNLILSNNNVYLGIIISLIVGVLSGVFPAAKAANMHPVKAIASK